jgi:hypothetical protein
MADKFWVSLMLEFPIKQRRVMDESLRKQLGIHGFNV